MEERVRLWVDAHRQDVPLLGVRKKREREVGMSVGSVVVAAASSGAGDSKSNSHGSIVQQ